MTGFFNTVALTASNTTTAPDDVTVAIILMLAGVSLGVSWLAFFDKHWVAYSMNPTKIARREMRIAAFAPITVPIIAAMLIVKTTREVKSVTA